MTVPQGFPAEDLLLDHPPIYKEQWRWIIIQAIVATLVTLLVVPIVIKQMCTVVEPTIQTKQPRRSKINTPTKGTEERLVVLNGNATVLLVLSNVMYFSFLVYLVLFQSPNNVYAGRKVFVAPLLTHEECTTIIDMANQAAQRKYSQTQTKLSQQLFLEPETEEQMIQLESMKKIVEIEPKGWKKDRHISYPTTDLNVAVDFSKSEKLYLKQILDSRLTPIIQRTYGITPDSIRANDIFIVRYDEDGQTSLSVHTDSSHVSFNILLNEEFEGGGTRFHDKKHISYFDVKPKRGQVLLNNGCVPHEGLKTTRGTRYIMVGFLSVDVFHPVTLEPSNLSIFSSYLSLPWWLSSIKLRMDYEYTRAEEEQRKALNFNSVPETIVSIQISIALLINYISPLEITTLVHPSSEQEFIHRLSSTANHTTTTSNQVASWFAGQNLNIDLFGIARGGWGDREADPSAYDEI